MTYIRGACYSSRLRVGCHRECLSTVPWNVFNIPWGRFARLSSSRFPQRFFASPEEISEGKKGATQCASSRRWRRHCPRDRRRHACRRERRRNRLKLRSPMHLVGQILSLEAITTCVSCSCAFSHSEGEDHPRAGEEILGRIKRRLPGIIRGKSRRGAGTNQALSLFPALGHTVLFPSFFFSLFLLSSDDWKQRPNRRPLQSRGLSKKGYMKKVRKCTACSKRDQIDTGC